MAVFYTKTTYITARLNHKAPAQFHFSICQCITHHAARITESTCHLELKWHLLWGYVLLQMWCCCNYQHSSAFQLWDRKSLGLFICKTAVFSGELSPLNLQLCSETIVRNSNLCIFQKVQIVLELQSTGNIGLVLLWIKANGDGWFCPWLGVK